MDIIPGAEGNTPVLWKTKPHKMPRGTLEGKVKSVNQGLCYTLLYFLSLEGESELSDKGTMEYKNNF